MDALRTVPCPEFRFQDAVITNGRMVLGIDRKRSHYMAERQVVAMLTLREGVVCEWLGGGRGTEGVRLASAAPSRAHRALCCCKECRGC